MPRFARLWMPGSVQHLIVRFVNRSYRMAGPAERSEYLRRVGLAVQHTDWCLLAFALMSNHVHLCAQVGESPAWQLMKPLQCGFATWLNHRDRTLGPVFAERFSSVACAPTDIARLIAYIHNNPVRAGLVARAADSSWTSHQAYLGAAAPPSWLDTQRGMALCGLAGANASDFDALVDGFCREPRDPLLSGAASPRTRALLREACGAPVEMSDLHYDHAGPQHQITVRPGTPLRPRWDGSQELVLALVARQTGVALERIRSRDKTRAVCHARRVALLAWERLGRQRIEMSTLLGIGSGTAAHLVRRDLQAAERATALAGSITQMCWAQASSS